MPTSPNNVFRQLQAFGITVLFLAYWFFVHSMANIDASQSFLMAFWLPFPQTFPTLDSFTPAVVLFLEMFSWRVLRHFLPVIIALILAPRATVGLF